MKRFWMCLTAGLVVLSAACAPGATPPPEYTTVPTLPPATATTPPTATAVPAASATPSAIVSPEASPTTAPSSPEAPATVVPNGPAIAPLTAGTPLTLTALDMQSASAGWAAAQAGPEQDTHLVITTDGGQTWRDVTPPQPVDAALAMGQGATFAAAGAQAAWATFFDRTGGPLAGQAYVWRTTDQGASWQPSAPLDLTDAELFSPSNLVFNDAQTGWLFVHVGAGMMHDYVMLFATHDGGRSWERLVDPFTETDNGLMQSCGKTGLAFADAQTGWITGDCAGVQPGAPYLYKTTDGGRTWAFAELPAPAEQPNLFQPDNQAVACGVQAPLYAQGPAVVLAVTCQDYNAGGSTAWLYRTADSGATWTTEALANAFSAGVFISPKTGWVLGPAANAAETTLSQTVDGGQSLNPLKQLSWTGPLDFVDPQTGWAIAQANGETALVHTTDGGKSWQVLAPQIAP